MYIDHADPFSFYDISEILKVYDAVTYSQSSDTNWDAGCYPFSRETSIGSLCTIDKTGGRGGRGSIFLRDSSLIKDISLGTKKICQFALRGPSTSAGTLECGLSIIFFHDDDECQGAVFFYKGKVSIYNAAGSKIASTVDINWDDDLSHSFEIKIVHGASGSISIAVDGDDVLTTSGNFSSGAAGIKCVRIKTDRGATNFAYFMNISDFLIADVSTGDDSFLGDQAVYYSPAAKDILTQFIDVTFTDGGSAQDDLELGGANTTESDVNFVVEIDAAGTPDTFKWSDDGGSTWEATGVSITGSSQTLNNGQTISFAATTGHSVGDQWSWTLPAQQYSKVDENTLNGSDYIQSYGALQKQFFQNYEKYDSLYDVTGICQVIYGGTSDGGTGLGLIPIFKPGAVEYPQSEINFSVITPAVKFSDWIYTNPGTGDPLTIDEVNAMTFGLKTDDTL